MQQNGLPPLNLPEMKIRTQMQEGILRIFDRLRRKFVALTPEEFVRQHFVNYLIEYLHYPETLMANEVGIDLNGTRKRCDTVVFGRDGLPMAIVEYKAPGVSVTQDVFDQIVRYNMRLKARYLIVSNGMRHFCCVMDYKADSYHFLPRIPDYKDISSPFSDN